MTTIAFIVGVLWALAWVFEAVRLAVMLLVGGARTTVACADLLVRGPKGRRLSPDELFAGLRALGVWRVGGLLAQRRKERLRREAAAARSLRRANGAARSRRGDHTRRGERTAASLAGRNGRS